jgi:hypothetical protein
MLQTRDASGGDGAERVVGSTGSDTGEGPRAGDTSLGGVSVLSEQDQPPVTNDPRGDQPSDADLAARRVEAHIASFYSGRSDQA